MSPTNVSKIANTAGRANLTDDQVHSLWEALETAKCHYDVRIAARDVERRSSSTDSADNRKLKALSGQADRLRARLEVESLRDRLGPFLPVEFDFEAAKTMLVAIEEAANVATSRPSAGVDFGSPIDGAVKDLAWIAEEHLNVRPTVSTVDDPSGPFIQFALEVLKLWGRNQVTPAAIKAALYRRQDQSRRV